MKFHLRFFEQKIDRLLAPAPSLDTGVSRLLQECCLKGIFGKIKSIRWDLWKVVWLRLGITSDFVLTPPPI